jgi:hypothetical protein
MLAPLLSFTLSPTVNEGGVVFAVPPAVALELVPAPEAEGAADWLDVVAGGAADWLGVEAGGAASVDGVEAGGAALAAGGEEVV